MIAPGGFGFRPEDMVLAIVPLFHANAWGLRYAVLMAGSDLLLPDRFLQPEPLPRMMAAVRPTFAAAVPTIWSGLLSTLEKNPQDISHLRTCVVGGAALPPSVMRTFADKYGVQLLHGWGMTEISPLGSVAHAPAGVTGEQAWAYRCTQGRFPAGVRARLVAEDGTVLPDDGESVGELEVRGVWVTGSYYSPRGGTVDPGRFHDGWLRTGDIGKISPDGFLTLVDRSKDVIKSGGDFLGRPGERGHRPPGPAVAEAAVIGVPDARWDERPLVAVVRSGEVTPEELRGFLADRFARWQLPEHWVFLDEVPKTGVGKFDKKRLRALYADGALTVSTVSGERPRPGRHSSR
ncbi:AMP-binding protein [Amycolatopsis methanolica]